MIYEWSIRVFLASSSQEALEKAVASGKESEFSYSSVGGDIIEVRFEDVLEIQDLSESELTDGTEVFSHIVFTDDREDLSWDDDPKDREGDDAGD